MKTAEKTTTRTIPTGTSPAGTGQAGDSPTGSPMCSSGSTRPRARHHLVSRPVEHLETELIELSARLCVGTYEILVVVGELDHRGTWALTGALSCAAWLATVTDVDVTTARSQVRVARTMREYPGLDKAMADGEISYAKARVLAAYLTPANTEALLEIAFRTPAGDLGKAIAAWSQRHDDQDTIRDRQNEARSVSWRTEPDGMIVITARLTPETAGKVIAVIDTIVTRNTAPAGASLPQQRADALITATTSTSPGTGSPATGGVATEMIVHVRADGNTLVDGTPLSDHAVTELLPEAFIRLLLHDTDRQPIDASPRRRFPTRRQRLVIDQTNTECQHPGCHVTDFLQYDHKHPYTQGGTTTINNLQRLCGPHNRTKHQDQN